MPRIITGTAKGLKIKAPKGEKTRPTVDRVKESLFNILSPYIMGAKVLDLFSGSGSLGLECLSRGAESCIFNDFNKKTLQLIKENAKFCRLEQKGKFFSMDFKALLSSLEGEKMDLIFMDPPYETNMIEDSLKLIKEMGLLAEDGLIICEHPIDKIIEFEKYFEIMRESKYGEIKITILMG